MMLSRVWSMPNKRTFQIKPIKELLERYVNYETWLDPFARNSNFCHCSNDINVKTKAWKHLDALEFLDMFGNAEGVLFDPPYSPTQMKESYKNAGLTTTEQLMQSSFYSKIKNKIAVIKPDTVISFGWNSNGMGKGRGYAIEEILLVAHGGNHNDTICMVEVRK